ncbi:hypothetical protein C1645_50584 [Glomus cerebriforme]|uniref:Uncharacterized protein n=1 Tax=Glomus cerebriforme TaxID=658196 RepID=A0A397TKC1_9GLOM|nr:hypothetical protein C1645_50584 [Glomus cerebriforme]
MSSEHSIPISPRKQSTMPQVSSREPIIPQRRNNTVPIISINQEHETINSRKIYQPQSSPVNSQDQVKHSDSSFSRSNDQIVTRKRQNSTPTVSVNRQNYIQNSPNGPSINDPNGPQIPSTSVPHRIETSKIQRNEHHRSISTPTINRSYDSPSSSPVSSSPKSINNKRHSQTSGSLSSSSTSSKPFQYKSHDQTFNETFTINGKNIPPALQPRSIPGMNQSYQGYPGRANGQNSPLNSRIQNPQQKQQKYPMGIHDGIHQKSVIGHYSPSTTPLPSPKTPQLKVLQEENVVLDDRDSPSTTPIPSPRFASRKMFNNNSNYEVRVSPVNTPASTPIIITPKITLEDSDLDDSDIDQEETLISYASSRNNSMKSSSSSYDPPKPAEVPTLKVERISYSRSDTPSEQLSANESEDISSEDDYENKEVKSESESDKTQTNKPAKKKKEPILAIDEYGFVYDVSEDDIPPGADRIQRMFVS